jgi:hypothetical protein
MAIMLFFGIVGLVAVLAVLGVWQAGRRSGEHPSVTARWVGGTIIGIGLWLAFSAGLALSGLLGDFGRTPPPMVLLAGVSGILTLGLAFSPFGTRLVEHTPVAWLVGFQGFRIVVELVLALLHQQGLIPIQMTFEGRNFDIVSGVSALLVAWLAARQQLPQWGLLLWNLLGQGLLLNIVVISILSLPIPIRAFFNEPANTIVATWPYVWLPVFLVQAALFGHVLMFRRLLARKVEAINNVAMNRR